VEARRVSMKRWCGAGQDHIWIRNDNTAQLCCSLTDRESVHSFKLDKVSDFFEKINQDSWQKQYRILESGPLDNDTCGICINNEKRVNDSQRIKINRYSENGFFLKIDFSNKCNLKCTMCNSSRSTSWIKDELELNKILKNDNLKRSVDPYSNLENKWWNDIPIEWWKKLGSVEISGGEPLYQEEAIMFLEFLASNCPDIKLVIITNTTILDNSIINLFKKIKNIQLLCSIDAWQDKVYEYARMGNRTLDTVKNNLITLYKHDIEFNICDTLHPITYDQFEIGEQWLKTNNIKCVHIKNYVYRPEYLDINRALPKTINSDSSEDQQYMFYKWITALDTVRNTQVLDVRPEFENWFEKLNAAS
jgi:MoaA/NifB/PqqE/SkfB family radical SAM enzyme